MARSGDPVVRLLGDQMIYTTVFPTLVDSQTVTTLIIKSQVIPGTYDLEFTNGDGQQITVPNFVHVQP